MSKKSIWTPVLGEELECRREAENSSDPYAVAVLETAAKNFSCLFSLSLAIQVQATTLTSSLTLCAFVTLDVAKHQHYNLWNQLLTLWTLSFLLHWGPGGKRAYMFTNWINYKLKSICRAKEFWASY